jgi:hypothetical protein
MEDPHAAHTVLAGRHEMSPQHEGSLEMQATQPLRTFQPAKAAIAAFVATAILIAVVVIASLLPSLAGTSVSSNAGSGYVPVRAEAYDSPLQYSAPVQHSGIRARAE